MKTLPNIDDQWGPLQRRAAKLSYKAKRLEIATLNNDEEDVRTFAKGVMNDHQVLIEELGFLLGFFSACERREQEDAEGVLEP